MEQPLISIIVPVYNVEDFLDACLESIVNQSYQHLEVLVVDDGSTDRCSDMCDRWAQRDERIRVIHQTNAGLSAARNTALDAMTGEWVVMVDSDDVLHPGAVALLLQAASTHKADIAVGDYITVDEHALPQWPAQAIGANAQARAYSQQEAILAIFYQRQLTHSAWARIYRSSLFDDIRYPVGMLYEDLAIIYPLLRKCDKVVKVNQVVYGYRQRQSSILGTFSPRRADVLNICERLESHVLTGEDIYIDAVRNRLLSAYFNILLLSNNDKTHDHKQLQDRCWDGIKRLRCKVLSDPRASLKNKLGILASYMGRPVLCSIFGHRYQPRP